MRYPVICLADEHRLDGNPSDDFFLRMTPNGRVCDAYEAYRHDHPGTYIHLGDTFDTLRAEAEDVKKAWGHLEFEGASDIFLLGNHEVSLARLESVAPGQVLERMEVNGYTLLHGHQLFKVSTQEWLLLGRLLYLNRITNRRWKCLERKIEQITGQHRDNSVAYAALEEAGISKAIFGHTHVQGQSWTSSDRPWKGDFWNPGAFWKDLTVVVFDGPESGPRFERII
jgi:predicted phosphodiesterase